MSPVGSGLGEPATGGDPAPGGTPPRPPAQRVAVPTMPLPQPQTSRTKGRPERWGRHLPAPPPLTLAPHTPAHLHFGVRPGTGQEGGHRQQRRLGAGASGSRAFLRSTTNQQPSWATKGGGPGGGALQTGMMPPPPAGGGVGGGRGHVGPWPGRAPRPSPAVRSSRRSRPRSNCLPRGAEAGGSCRPCGSVSGAALSTPHLPIHPGTVQRSSLAPL